MIRPRSHYRFLALIAFAAMWGPGFVAQAEQPPATPPPPAEAKTAPPPRPKPQIIYRLPRSSSYAATLHSQAKTHSNALPIDPSMPTSLQISRAAANEEAARAEREQQQQSAPKADSPRQQRVKRSKPHFNRPQMRKQGPGKGRGPGFSRGKSGKK